MKIVAAVSIAFVMLIGVTGCGSDDDVQAESRVKNVALEASDASDAPSRADCLLLDRLFLNRFDLDDLDDLLDRLDRRDLLDLYDRLGFDFLDSRDFFDLYWPFDYDLLDEWDPDHPDHRGSDGPPTEYLRDRSVRGDREIVRLMRRLHLDLDFLDRIDDGDRSAHLDLLELRDALDRLNQCAAASESGADAPEGDDVDGG